MKVIKRFNPGPGEIVFLANQKGETMIELIDFSEEKVWVKGMVMSYEIEESLETYHDKAMALGYEATEIVDCQPKPRYFRVMAPDGIVVEFSK